MALNYIEGMVQISIFDPDFDLYLLYTEENKVTANSKMEKLKPFEPEANNKELPVAKRTTENVDGIKGTKNHKRLFSGKYFESKYRELIDTGVVSTETMRLLENNNIKDMYQYEHEFSIVLDLVYKHAKKEAMESDSRNNISLGKLSNQYDMEYDKMLKRVGLYQEFYEKYGVSCIDYIKEA